jgi:hypothetical protein
VCALCGLRVTGGAPDDHECDEVALVRRQMEWELGLLLNERKAA